ncbi:LAT2 domain-containing protein isoform X2 [Syngnathus scovelli]|uniref:LAT2 domain-containing protein isoform X2 n=1 Tax=Syngnathus scovelli TaxID=161590 RepID=UPI0035CC03C1
MLGNSSLQCAVGGVASLALLSLLGLLCLRCKTKSKIHEEAEIYNSHTFQREGSIFAVMRSKTVTKANQMTPSINEDVYPATYSVAGSPTGYWEHIYVEPLPVTVYENEHLRTKGGLSKVTDQLIAFSERLTSCRLQIATALRLITQTTLAARQQTTVWDVTVTFEGRGVAF